MMSMCMAPIWKCVNRAMRCTAAFSIHVARSQQLYLAVPILASNSASSIVCNATVLLQPSTELPRAYLAVLCRRMLQQSNNAILGSCESLLGP